MSRNKFLIGLCAVSLGGCTLFQPPSEDPVLTRLNELERRLENIERVVDNQSLVTLTQQVDSLDRRADQLRGEAETLRHEAEQTAERQRLLYADLDARIQGLESNVKRGGSTGGNVLEGGRLAPGQLPIPEGSDRDNYQVALELLREERYDMAITAFKQFLVAFSDSGLADNAQYWLAESYYASDRFEQALKDFQVVISAYPRSRKIPDALLKMGYCNYSLKRWDSAREIFARVQREHENTTAARLAGQYLKRMDDEGV